MKTNNEKNASTSFISMATIGMAIIAYLVGAGFSSGQEILQFFCYFGDMWWVPIFSAFVVIFWSCMSFAKAGNELNFEKNEDLYYYYGGKYIGKFFDYASTLVVYCMTFYMLSAAGATLKESFGLPSIVGTVILGVAIVLTLLSGFSGLSKVLAVSGTLNIALIILVSAYTLLTNFQHIPEGIAMAQSGEAGLVSAGAGKVGAGLAYHGISTLYIGVFIIQTARVNSKISTTRGSFMGSAGYTLLTVMSALTFFAVLPEVSKVDVPNLALAYSITSAAGTFFTFIIMLEIYNSASALIWTVANRIEQDEKSNKFRMATIVLTIASIAICTLLPYKTLVGYIMTYGGYIGAIFFGSIVLKDIMNFIGKKQKNLEKAA